jgi:hypothetical protein
MSQLNDLSRSLTSLEQDNTIIVVIEMSQSSWLVAGIVPGIERHPLKKLEPNEGELLRLLMRWRAEATKMGCTIAVAYEAGRDGFWLARWLRAHDIETYVIHPTSVAVSREHRRAKTDRLDTGLLKRVFIGWLRGEPDHCHMVTIPTLAEEDAKRPNREREGLVRERTRIVNRMKSCLARFGVRSLSRRCARHRNVSQRWSRRRGFRSRQTHFSNFVETWRDCALSWTRSRKLRRRVRNAWNRRLRKNRMRWSDCSPVLLALASKRRTCWCMRSCRGVCGIDELWRATLVSPARQMRAAAFVNAARSSHSPSDRHSSIEGKWHSTTFSMSEVVMFIELGSVIPCRCGLRRPRGLPGFQDLQNTDDPFQSSTGRPLHASAVR